jgi:hypothetical protein
MTDSQDIFPWRKCQWGGTVAAKLVTLLFGSRAASNPAHGYDANPRRIHQGLLSSCYPGRKTTSMLPPSRPDPSLSIPIMAIGSIADPQVRRLKRFPKTNRNSK